MTIQSRGARGQHLVTRGTVPVELVAKKIFETKNSEKVANRFGLTYDEVFECVDFCADQNPPNSNSFINIKANLDQAKFDASSISEDLWYNIVAYGKMFYPKEHNVNHLFRQGLRILVLECYMDIYSGNRMYTQSEIHNTVFEAVVTAIGEPYTTEKALELLGVDEYLEIGQKLEESNET